MLAEVSLLYDFAAVGSLRAELESFVQHCVVLHSRCGCPAAHTAFGQETLLLHLGGKVVRVGKASIPACTHFPEWTHLAYGRPIYTCDKRKRRTLARLYDQCCRVMHEQRMQQVDQKQEVVDYLPWEMMQLVDIVAFTAAVDALIAIKQVAILRQQLHVSCCSCAGAFHTGAALRIRIRIPDPATRTCSTTSWRRRSQRRSRTHRREQTHRRGKTTRKPASKQDMTPLTAFFPFSSPPAHFSFNTFKLLAC